MTIKIKIGNKVRTCHLAQKKGHSTREKAKWLPEVSRCCGVSICPPGGECLCVDSWHTGRQGQSRCSSGRLCAHHVSRVTPSYSVCAMQIWALPISFTQLRTILLHQSPLFVKGLGHTSLEWGHCIRDLTFRILGSNL